MPPIERRVSVAVSQAAKRRLDDMRDGKQEALNNVRMVSLGEIIDDLLAEHDRNREQVSP